MDKQAVIDRAQVFADKTRRTFHIYTREERVEAVPGDLRGWPLCGPKELWTLDSVVTPAKED